MKLPQTLSIVICVLIYCADSEMHNETSAILYPRSAVDLILKFFKTYKHIKRLTLFLCDNSLTTHLSFPIDFRLDYNLVQLNAKVVPPREAAQNDDVNPKLKQTPKPKQKQQLHDGNCCLNFQQIVKYLMAAGNFLIKGDGNIDVTMFTTAGYNCNDVKYEKLDSIYSYSLSDMLERGDFKQGVVLDLRCRPSRFILQQVNNDLCPIRETSFDTHFVHLETTRHIAIAIAIITAHFSFIHFTHVATMM